MLTDAEIEVAEMQGRAKYNNQRLNVERSLSLCKADAIAEFQHIKTVKELIAQIEDSYGDGYPEPLIQIGLQEWQEFRSKWL